MAETEGKSKQMHLFMFPWVAYGHFIPFLHLSNKFAEKGHKVSFLLPNSAHLQLHQLNLHPNLIHFLPLSIPHIDGLPHGSETASDVPFQLHNLLFKAFDKTQDQVLSHVRNLKPHLVIYDLAYWIPTLVRDCPEVDNGIKFISYSVLNTVVRAFYSVPSRMNMDNKGIMPSKLEELMQPPPGFPSSRIHINRHEASRTSFYFETTGELTMRERLIRSIKDSDVLASRTCREIEGSFCDYISEQFEKPVLLTGPALPESSTAKLEEKWENWLSKFEVGSVVYCAFGSQITLPKHQFQELVLGFELTGLPFLVALTPPDGCATTEEALPEGFEERVRGRGCVYGGWVPQPLILKHPSIGCFVSHCGFGSMWESLLSDCQIVLIPYLLDQIFGTKLMVEELKVAVEVERMGEQRWVSKESLCEAVKLVMDKDNDVAAELKSNHAELRKTLCSHNIQEYYIENFIQSLQEL